MNLHCRRVSLAGLVGGLKEKWEGRVSDRTCFGIASKRGGIRTGSGNSGNHEQTPCHCQSLSVPHGSGWCDPEQVLRLWGETRGFFLSVNSAVNENSGRGWCWQEGFELLGGVIAGMGSAAGLRLHSHLRFYPVLNSLNALLAFALLVCNWVQWGLGFKELFWGLQPCKLKAKAYKRWGCMVIFTRILKRPSLSCSLLCFCCCSAPARIPRDCSHSKQILRSHTASKSSGVSSCTLLVPSCHENKCLLWNLATESLRALTIDMGSRERSLLCGRDFSRWCHEKKYRMMTCFENTS